MGELMSFECDDWFATSKSIKTPQIPEIHHGSNESTISSYYLEYSDNFLYPGSIEFKYRANVRLINLMSNSIVNGIFTFSIDGVDQNVGADYFMSGIWNTVIRDIPPGPHRLVWKYTRYNNVDADQSQEDLAAEIEYIKIKGVSYTSRQCSVCNNGVPNQERSRCLQCMANQYLDDLSLMGGQCKKCPEGTYSPPGARGEAACKAMEPCVESDFSFDFTECDVWTGERM